MHEFSAIIETTDSPETVQAGVLRQARRLVPGYRIELITGPAPSQDHGTADPARWRGVDPWRESVELCAANRSGQLVLEVPLRCGSLVRGRLRIRSRGAGTASLRNETVRRLNTLCTIGASALDRLCLQEEWPWDDNVAHLSDPRGADSGHGSAKTEGTLPQAARLQDATFLNAVLPFALSQARRHLEPLSIVCVSIDRLRGIQDLLGRAAVDRLVRNVGETVGTLIRGSDIVVRLDDDRVVAVLPRAPGRARSKSPREFVVPSPRTPRATATSPASRSRSAWPLSPLAPIMSYRYSARPMMHWNGHRARAETRPLLPPAVGRRESVSHAVSTPAS